MKITSAEFVKSVVHITDASIDGLPEVALVGRSNVGKSSLINTFVGRRGLAKTSSTPGKTRTINFYRVNNQFFLVDLPGFGYARVSHEERLGWERMMGRYFEKRKSLKGVLVILDPRRDAGEAEEGLYRWLEGFNVPVLTVFTKADKLSKNQLASRVAQIKRSIPVGHPVLFSSHTGEGKIALGKRLQEMVYGQDT